MNRVKSEIQNFPDSVIHICWLVDFWGRRREDLQGSDILYVWDEEWVKSFRSIGVENVFNLPPATDAVVYKPIKQQKKSDFIFLGHMPKPWTEKEKNRIVGKKNNKNVDFQVLLQYIEKFIYTCAPTETLYQYFLEEGIIIDKSISKTVSYDISSRSFRHIRRNAYLNLFFEKDYKIAIYGSDNWSLYETYKTFYRGYIDNFEELNAKMQEAKILLHDGYCPHFRTFDAMAAGVVVATAKPIASMEKVWNNLGFKEKEDYICVDMYARDVDYDCFANEKFLIDIQVNAREKVLQNHLWVHRALKVIRDVKKLKKELDVKNQS